MIHKAGGPARNPTDYQGEVFFNDYPQATQIVTDIAVELPSYVIADLLGIPLDDGRRLYVLTEKMHAAPGSIPETERGSAAMEMIMYAAGVRQSKIDSPADDLASDLVHGMVDGEELSPEEFAWFFLLLIVFMSTSSP